MANPNSDLNPTALSEKGHHQHHVENYQNSHDGNKDDDTGSGFWGFFDSIPDYSMAFSNSVRILFSNSFSILKTPDLFLRILDPIVENNRKLFWFLFPEETEETFISLYDMESRRGGSAALEENGSGFALSNSPPPACDLITGCSDADKLSFIAADALDGSDIPANPMLGDGSSHHGEGVWWMPVLSVLFITLLPCTLIFLSISMKRMFGAKTSTTTASAPEMLPKFLTLSMLAFAAGGLLGDCVLHLFPAIFSTHNPCYDQHHHHGGPGNGSFNMTALSFVFGVFFFWIFELMATSSPPSMALSSSSTASLCSHAHKYPIPNASPERPKKRSSRSKSVVRRRMVAEDEFTAEDDPSSTPMATAQRPESTEAHRSSNHHDPHIAMMHPNHNFAMVHISADVIHNFTDGLALAAAWSTETGGGRLLGLSTTLAILLHEIPHELGDIAALVHLAGWSFHAALRMQLITSTIGSFGGLLFGLLLSKLSHNFDVISALLSAILPFSAGGFMYLSLAIILPQLKTECALLAQKRDAWLMVLFALLGVLLLALV